MTKWGLTAAAAGAVMGVAALGGSPHTSAADAKAGGKKGGSVKLLAVESFAHLDPGIAYFQPDYIVTFAAQRPLYYYRPGDPLHPVPDLASGPPKISADGKTVTVKIRSGVKYGTNDPKSSVNGKEVTSADVKYAIERGYNPHIANGYLASYFPLVGASKAKGGPISGITTPDKHTIVLKLTTGFGATTAKALVMPITIPVPKSYAKSYDAKNPSGFDAKPTKQAFTGPYMIKSYSPGKSLTLVRNPQWTGPKTGDIRPAYLDKVVWEIGVDPNVAGRQIFNGKNLANGDTLGAGIVKLFATKAKDRLILTPNGNRFVTLNYAKKPFSNVNVRRAAAAVLDRTAMQRVRGGRAVGAIGTHLLPPGMPGFKEAGGFKGPAKFLKKPQGDVALAKSFMKKAGYKNGTANGQKIVLYGDNTSPAKENAQVVASSLSKLGFKVQSHLVDHSVFLAKYCTVTAQLKKIDVCANLGWLADFADPYAMLYVNFYGNDLPAVNNFNSGLYDNPKINKAMNKGGRIANEAARAKAWGAIDRALTNDVAAIPWFWDNVANVESKNVKGVVAKWNAAWDVSFMSLR
jgi:peptide/nickel transport system substrate-binding protein